MYRDRCAAWRPRASATTVTDSKGREWRIADRTGLDAFSREVPVGWRDAGYRTFWRDDHVRAIAFHGNDDDRSVRRDALMTQLRRSWRVDHPEAPLVSKSERFQQLYDRRGMGRLSRTDDAPSVLWGIHTPQHARVIAFLRARLAFYRQMADQCARLLSLLGQSPENRRSPPRN